MTELINLLAFGLIFGLIIGLIVGFLQGLAVEECKDIKPVETIELSSSKNKYQLIKSIIQGMFLGLFSGMILGTLFGLLGLLNGRRTRWLKQMSLEAIISIGLIFGLFFGMIKGLKDALPRSEIEISTSHNQGIKASVKNNVKFSLISSISILIITGIALIYITQFPSIITVSGLTIGNVIKISSVLSLCMMLISILFVEVSATQHLSLKIVLFLRTYARAIAFNFC